MQLGEWREKKYYKSDATAQLKVCPDQIERRDAETLPVEEFVKEYERNCRPVIIRGTWFGS